MWNFDGVFRLMRLGVREAADAKGSPGLCLELPFEAGKLYGLRFRNHAGDCISAHALGEHCETAYGERDTNRYFIEAVTTSPQEEKAVDARGRKAYGTESGEHHVDRFWN